MTQGLTSGWCRITIHLPSRSREERIAVVDIIRRFRSKYQGCTHSNILPTAYKGWCISTPVSGLTSARASWIDDAICMLILDIPRDVGDLRLLDREVDIIQHYIFKKYDKVGASQDELWIIVQPTLKATLKATGAP